MGEWLLRSFAEHMNCERADQDVLRWNAVYQLTHIRTSAHRENLEPFPPSLENLTFLLNLVREVLVPFGIPDPVVALDCSLGTAALLNLFANFCLQVFADKCVDRAVRVLQLSKLFTLFNFADHGAMMQE